MTDGAAFQYRAFLSYSHADRAEGDWLHRALEGYRVPKDLVGRPTGCGAVPARLRPVFRDRFDLEAGHSLTEQVAEALRRSEALVVICSPASARSKYVNEEIRRFKAEGRTQRVFPIIVGGIPGDPDRDCFAPALRQQLLPDGTLGAGLEEPIAADARPEGDGRELALLKLIAGLLGVDLDELRKREEIERRRRQRKAVAVAAAMTVLAIVASASAVYAFRARNEAVAARMVAEEMKARAEQRYEQAMNMNLKLVVTKATFESVTRNIPFQLSQVQAKGEDDEFQEFLQSSPNPDHLWHRLAQVLIEFVQRPPRQLAGLGKEREWGEHARLILRNLGDRPEHREDRETLEREMARLSAGSG